MIPLMVYGLIAASVLFIAAFYYLKDIVFWRKVLGQDLKDLAARRETCPPQTRKALFIVENQCRSVLDLSFCHESAIRRIPQQFTTLAGCYYPGESEPCLQATPERIIRCIEASLPRYQRILERPGFRHVARLSIRDITLPLGFTGFVRRFRSLWLMRYLMADLLLYLGELAVAVYSEQLPPIPQGDRAGIEETLRELSTLSPSTPVTYPEKIQRIRNSLVGVPGILVKEPTPTELSAALIRVSESVAESCFPDSSSPLYEARIGPLAHRLGAFLTSVGRREDYPLRARILSMRLSTLFKTGGLGGVLLPQTIKDRLEKTLRVSGWLKWPLKAYLMTSNGVFWKFAADVGWFTARKTLLVLFFGRCFDHAVREIHQVYRQSLPDRKRHHEDPVAEPKSGIDRFSAV